MRFQHALASMKAEGFPFPSYIRWEKSAEYSDDSRTLSELPVTQTDIWFSVLKMACNDRFNDWDRGRLDKILLRADHFHMTEDVLKAAQWVAAKADEAKPIRTQQEWVDAFNWFLQKQAELDVAAREKFGRQLTMKAAELEVPLSLSDKIVLTEAMGGDATELPAIKQAALDNLVLLGNGDLWSVDSFNQYGVEKLNDIIPGIKKASLNDQFLPSLLKKEIKKLTEESSDTVSFVLKSAGMKPVEEKDRSFVVDREYLKRL